MWNKNGKSTFQELNEPVWGACQVKIRLPQHPLPPAVMIELVLSIPEGCKRLPLFSSVCDPLSCHWQGPEIQTNPPEYRDTSPSKITRRLPGMEQIRLIPFQSDDAVCRQWAAQQTGTSPNDAVNQNLVTGGVLGTLAGAGLGAAIGAAYGNPGAGAAIGAASGLIGGTAVASGPAYGAGYAAQTRYDNAYVQCMYAKGNQIPGVMPQGEPIRRLLHRRLLGDRGIADFLAIG